MSKLRLLIFSGFLGSGKTTTMVETAKFLKAKGIKAALITNDLGSNLVDTNYARMEKLPVSEIPDGCFCHDVDNLVETIEALAATERPDVIFAEPVGSCVDIVRNVYADLDKRFPERFSLAPFTAVIDPFRYESIYMGIGENTFNPQATYMYKKQIEEADLLLLNKIDLLAAERREAILTSIRETFPRHQVIPISSHKKTNFAQWTAAITNGQLSGIKDLDIDWNYVLTGENTMGWYNKDAVVKSRAGAAVDFNAFAVSLMLEIRKAFLAAQSEIVHCKIICADGDDYCKAALTGVGREVFFSHTLRGRHASVKLNINTRALALPKAIESLVESALGKAVAAAGLSIHEQRTQAFDQFAEAPAPAYVP